MSQLASFSISTPSRHPANQKGYDPDRHRYRADYVDPRSWDIFLHALPAMAFKNSLEQLKILNAIASFRWTVKQVEGPFSITFVEDPILSTHTLETRKTKVSVPSPGKYEIILQVDLKDGTSATNIREYHLRDFLIVGIGDSFASGQGNPDVPAIPSLDQQEICQVTTLALIITSAKEKIEKFFAALKQEGKNAIEAIPFVGKVVIVPLNIADRMVEIVEGGIANLIEARVDVVRDISGAVVEGAKEFASWIGIGAGGDTDKIISRPAGWQEPNAYRSYRSGQSLAARQIEIESPFGADRITFLSFARSGSEIKDGILGPRAVDPDWFGVDFDDNLTIDGWTHNRGQIEEAKDAVRGRRIDALIISIGVNDLGFSTHVSNSILWENGEKRNARIKETKIKIENQLPHDLEMMKKAIDSQLMPRKVFITEYPVGVFKEVAKGKPCDVLTSHVNLDLSKFEAIDLVELGRLLNAKIRAKADEFGWVLVDGIERDFDGHGYCARRSYFVSAKRVLSYSGRL